MKIMGQPLAEDKALRRIINATIATARYVKLLQRRIANNLFTLREVEVTIERKKHQTLYKYRRVRID